MNKSRTVGFFYVDLGNKDMMRLASRMVASVRRVIPRSSIVQFTCAKTHALPFADKVIVRAMDGLGLMESRVDHFAHFEHDEALFLDPDILVQKDVWPVFDSAFDVALTARNAKLVCDGEDRSDDMPYNTGVMFSRGNGFWRAALKKMRGMSLDDRNWFGDQIAVAELVKAGGFNVLELPGEVYNHTPATESEDVSDKAVVHYKGVRKKTWMLRKRMPG